MPFDEARNGEAPLQLDDLGLRPDKSGDLFVRPETDDAAVAYRQGFGLGLFGFEGDDLAPAQHQIGRGRSSRLTGGSATTPEQRSYESWGSDEC